MIKNITFYGFFILLAVSILAYVFKGISPETKQLINKLESEKKELNDKISNLKADNRRIATDIALYIDTLSVLQLDLLDIEIKRIAAIRYYEKRIRNIDNLTIHGLDSLFAERYRLSGSDSEGDSH